MLAVFAAVVLGAVFVLVKTEPGAAIRATGGEHTGRHVRPADVPRQPHAKPLHSHAAPRGFAIAAPVESSAVATIPDPKPFVRTA